MLGHTCSNLNDLPAFSAKVAGRVLRARQLSDKRGRHRALGVKTASGAASHAGLSQQDISPSYTISRAPLAASPSQPQQHGFLHRFPRSAQARQRDVRAHIRAPAIPALESQPYREGSDKTSQLQAGELQGLSLVHLQGYIVPIAKSSHSAALAWRMRIPSSPMLEQGTLL